MRYLIVLVLSVCCVACKCNRESGKEGAAAAPLADTPENRMQAAVEFTKAYPTEEWKADVLGRIQENTGKDVAKDFSERVGKSYSAETILEIRTGLLRDTFTAPELQALTALAKQPAGKQALKKFYQFDDKLKAAILPELTKVFAGLPE